MIKRNNHCNDDTTEHGDAMNDVYSVMTMNGRMAKHSGCGA